MNPKQLFHEGGKPVDVWQCTKCRCLFGPPHAQQKAEQCCQPYHCKDCGAETNRYVLQCDTCRRAAEAKKNMETLEAAEKLETWDGWVYCEGVGREFFPSIEELLEEEGDEHAELPEFAFVCNPIKMRVPTVADIVEQACEDLHEDASDDVAGEDELEEALRVFAQANEHVVSYEPDWKRAVRIPANEALAGEAQKGETP